MRVLAAMSGGVDSAVAAALAVEAGHEVVGVHMALSRNREQFRAGSRGCCSIEDAGDARRAADVLGIPYYVWDLSERFEDTVVADFLSEYEAGRTPNPCVRCNEHIKFEALLDKATALGFDAVATGHYAQVLTREVTVPGPDGDPVTRTVRELHRSPNDAKDQSYVLAVMGQERLARSIFPLGGFASKDEVRAEAERRGLSVSNKPDSYDICFVSDGDTQGFLKARLGARTGEIVDTEGEVLGEHEGAYAFTVGQRKGLSLGRPAADGKPRYVLEVEPVSNRVVVGPAELLTVDRIEGDRSVWLADDVLAAAGWEPAPAGPDGAASGQVSGWFDASVQVRAHGAPVPARVRAVVGQADDGEAPGAADGARTEVELTGETLRGVAAGQSLVVYQGTRVIGQSTVQRAYRARRAASAAR
ncbi:tRNA 2-thiouridine(34) synthase MnmA [Oerskovia turbata]|uniref:tRNA-specific 2-thiouridylase MnmA n=1 Tax=Oerskovia turbata TaxID=1713 RepID=A0A4Q1KWU5_9CELL|nr:tRNA 2-thiouridine(34) synthase MnmA [Oerskovia turbata]RXR26618.1 tRNA 2-thiouridine(34) synthase MnmA [Oerskovia turbata]RXR34315.1 tRNA 2-thiouridine(34) synthase MnmA [Oerskovia turbata]